MKRPIVVWLLAIASLLPGLTGCGSSEYSSAEGVVTLDGSPLADATVVFISPGRPLATARTNPDGKYSMETGSVEGIKPGEYAVTVTAFQKAQNGKPIPKLSTPEKYSKAESSDLKAVIEAGKSHDINFDLSAKEDS